jgi:hypothetical protein
MVVIFRQHAVDGMDQVAWSPATFIAHLAIMAQPYSSTLAILDGAKQNAEH